MADTAQTATAPAEEAWTQVREALAPLLPHLSRTVADLTPLVQQGALSGVAEALGLLLAVRDALTDNQVERLAQDATELLLLVDRLFALDPVHFMDTARRATDQAWAQAQSDPPRGGLLGLLRALGEPEVRKGLGFALALLREFLKEKPAAS